MSLAARKAAARATGFARRKLAFDEATAAQAGYLCHVLARHRGVPVSGYMPMRTEIDPLPAMAEAAAQGPVGVPVIIAKGQPLQFARWDPGCAMVEGAFRALVPATLAWMTPQILIVPLVAFDQRGGRLGYGGGFYDRTLQGLRATGPVMAIGFAFSSQQDDDLPLEPTDQPLDLIVTEQGIITP